MTYTETLALARAHNINLCELCIANEVSAQFGEDHPRFEDICSCMEKAWLKSDSLTEWALVYSLHELLEDEQVSLEDVLAYGEDYDKVVENACYM